MRHSRSEEFDAELDPSHRPDVARWTDLAADPNSAAVLAHRAETLRAAWRPPIADRVTFLEDRCRSKKVLDIGCVAHDVARLDSPNWLHGRLAAAAERCIGVDVLADGVAEMTRRGFEVVIHDFADGLGPLAEIAPFDVIVAGELIEHVESLDMLFRIARDGLSEVGELIITTPNPYAPHRVRAAQLGVVWENVDHIVYAFPSGMAELAERHGLVLSEATVTIDHRCGSLRDVLRAVKRRLKGRQWMLVGFATIGERRVRKLRSELTAGWLDRTVRRRQRFLGETFIYVVTRSHQDPDEGNPTETVPSSRIHTQHRTNG